MRDALPGLRLQEAIVKPGRVALLCVVSFAGGIASFIAGAYLWLDSKW